MKNSLLLIIFCFSVLMGSVVPNTGNEIFAQEGLFIDNMIGSWKGDGKLMGKDAEFIMKWEWVLEKKFIRLTFENRILQNDNYTTVIKAYAFYKPKDDERYEGTWFDSRGIVLPLEANVKDFALISLWGTPEIEQGKTIYKPINDDKIEVKDFVLKDGDWKQFGIAVYQRE